PGKIPADILRLSASSPLEQTYAHWGRPDENRKSYNTSLISDALPAARHDAPLEVATADTVMPGRYSNDASRQIVRPNAARHCHVSSAKRKKGASRAPYRGVRGLPGLAPGRETHG